MPSLTHITLTGIDNTTDKESLAEISLRHPRAEWGILYSPKLTGQHERYPSMNHITDLLENTAANVRFALHICGKGVDDFIRAEPTVTRMVDMIVERRGRIQLNFNREKSTQWTPEELKATLAKYPKTWFIMQHNDGNRALTDVMRYVRNLAYLFDSSGGNGKSPERWPQPLPYALCGFAGGIGPDNIEYEYPRIRERAGTGLFWIDMESKLRTQFDNQPSMFDLDKCQQVLNAVAAMEYVPEVSAPSMAPC